MATKYVEERKTVTRERILDSAKKLFCLKGYYETSMDDIAEDSGLSKGAIYGHFKSKEQLFLSVQQRNQKFLIDQTSALFSPKDSAIKKYIKTYDAIFKQCEYPLDICRMNLEFTLHATRMESLKDEVKTIAITGHTFLKDIVDDAIKNKEFRSDVDADALTSIIDAILDGLSLHQAMGKNLDWDKVREALEKMISEGVLIKRSK